MISIKKRFEAKYLKAPSGCWEWTATKNTQGYGRVRYNGWLQSAHRVSIQIYQGILLKEGELVLHSCDNTSCVNPEHLRVGTHQDNMDDKTKRRRHAPAGGMLNPNYKYKAITPAGRFDNFKDAAKFYEVSEMTMRRRCMNPNDKPARNCQVPPIWKLSTWKEIGFNYEERKV